MSRPPISPGQAHVEAKAIEKAATRIVAHARTAITALHDAQPGFPSSSDGQPTGRGGHADPTADLALNPDHARMILDEVTQLFDTVLAHTARLDHLMRNWAGPAPKWREALATEAAVSLDDEHNYCAAHLEAGLMERTRNPGGRLCRRCELDRREIGADPPPWIIEKRHRGRHITTIDMAKAKRDAKVGRKRRRRSA